MARNDIEELLAKCLASIQRDLHYIEKEGRHRKLTVRSANTLVQYSKMLLTAHDAEEKLKKKLTKMKDDELEKLALEAGITEDIVNGND